MSENESFRILNKAWVLGINALDTSSEYGLSEKRIYNFSKVKSQ